MGTVQLQVLPVLVWIVYHPPLILFTQIVYTERFESKQDHDTSPINLIHCSRFESVNMSQAMSDDQQPYIISSTSQRNCGQNCEEVKKTQLPKNPSRKDLMALPKASENQGESSLPVPHSEVSLPTGAHTIILDFSMVHFVDSQASVTLRQVSTEEALTRALIPSCCHHPTLILTESC